MEVIRNETTEEREGRDGRIRTSKRIEWVVVRPGGEFVTSFGTKREAEEYAKRQTAK